MWHCGTLSYHCLYLPLNSYLLIAPNQLVKQLSVVILPFGVFFLYQLASAHYLADPVASIYVLFFYLQYLIDNGTSIFFISPPHDLMMIKYKISSWCDLINGLLNFLIGWREEGDILSCRLIFQFTPWGWLCDMKDWRCGVVWQNFASH